MGSKAKIAEGPRLFIRRSRADDAPLLSSWLEDPEVRSYYGFGGAPAAGEKSQGPGGTFLIVAKDGDHPIGFIDLECLGFRYDITIAIGDGSYRGKGLGEEAMTLAIEYAFRELDWNHLGLQVFGHNERAIRLYRRLGFRTRRRMKDRILFEGKRYDWLFMVLARDRWDARNAADPDPEGAGKE
ncbi:MAG: GNAT family N-acetyltransferase [Planctomycetes bacterium]|nr:GNAT family N-acetyltransferase [Planctomycetota bacterium]